MCDEDCELRLPLAGEGTFTATELPALTSASYMVPPLESHFLAIQLSLQHRPLISKNMAGGGGEVLFSKSEHLFFLL